MKDSIKIVICTIVGTILAFYGGAMFNFFPFLGNDLMMREIGFCTLIICAVIAICTCIILNAIKKNDGGKHRNEDSDKSKE